MTADVLILPRGGRVVNAPAAGTVLVRPTGDGDGWVVEFRSYTERLRRHAPRYGRGHTPGTARWIQDGQAAALEIAEAHGLSIYWHHLADRPVTASGVFFREAGRGVQEQ